MRIGAASAYADDQETAASFHYRVLTTFLNFAILIAALVIATTVAVHFLGISGSQTLRGPTNQCGYVAICSVQSPSGLVLTMLINTTSLKSNASLSFQVDEVNPTAHYINLSVSTNWLLSSIPLSFPCYNSHAGGTPFGIAVFRGYYTLQNITSATNIKYIVDPACPVETSYIVDYSVPPSSLIQARWSDGGVTTMWPDSGVVYAINGGLVACDTNSLCAVNSLGSSQPAGYTIVAGDEWGALLLFHFSVVAG
jgi:hypothetical protein